MAVALEKSGHFFFPQLVEFSKFICKVASEITLF